MTHDDQARQRLVEIALQAARTPMRHTGICRGECVIEPVCVAYAARQLAGFKDPKKGHWCAAGLTAAMAKAGLLVPAPGTPARRGAIALLDFVIEHGAVEWPFISSNREDHVRDAKPGDIIAWKQNPEPAEWLFSAGTIHAFAGRDSARSMCVKAPRAGAVYMGKGERCSSCVWETRKGHVALIVETDDESLVTVGWNEGPSPGRVMMRRLWRDHDTRCTACDGTGYGGGQYEPSDPVCTVCRGRRTVARSSTVLWRRPGGLYGVARPVAA